MPKYIFSEGDYFTFGEANQDKYGVALPDGKAVLINGAGGRQGYQITSGMMPDDAFPVRSFENLPYEVKVAVMSVNATLEGLEPTFISHFNS